MADELDMDALTEMAARALCEQRIRLARRWDTDKNRLEQMIPAAVDFAWDEDIDPARAVLAAIDLPTLIRKAKAEAYEDAAKVADQCGNDCHNDTLPCDVAWSIADIIRQRAGEVTK